MRIEQDRWRRTKQGEKRLRGVGNVAAVILMGAIVVAVKRDKVGRLARIRVKLIHSTLISAKEKRWEEEK